MALTLRVTKIRNSQGNTHLIRIFSKNPDTIKSLLTQGLYIANRRYKIIPPKEETRHTPCRRCQQYGHEQMQCPNVPTCFKCGTQNNKCTHTHTPWSPSHLLRYMWQPRPLHRTDEMPQIPTRHSPTINPQTYTPGHTTQTPLAKETQRVHRGRLSWTRKGHIYTHTHTVTATTYAAKI